MLRCHLDCALAEFFNCLFVSRFQGCFQLIICALSPSSSAAALNFPNLMRTLWVLCSLNILHIRNQAILGWVYGRRQRCWRQNEPCPEGLVAHEPAIFQWKHLDLVINFDRREHSRTGCRLGRLMYEPFGDRSECVNNDSYGTELTSLPRQLCKCSNTVTFQTLNSILLSSPEGRVRTWNLYAWTCSDA